MPSPGSKAAEEIIDDVIITSQTSSVRGSSLSYSFYKGVSHRIHLVALILLFVVVKKR